MAVTSGPCTVEVYADVLCPFTHAGLHTLIDRRTARGLTEPRLRIHAWPLELINGKPLDPHHVGAEIVALRGQSDRTCSPASRKVASPPPPWPPTRSLPQPTGPATRS